MALFGHFKATQKKDTGLQTCVLQAFAKTAGEGIRTLDVQLGKPVIGA